MFFRQKETYLLSTERDISSFDCVAILAVNRNRMFLNSRLHTCRTSATQSAPPQTRIFKQRRGSRSTTRPFRSAPLPILPTLALVTPLPLPFGLAWPFAPLASCTGELSEPESESDFSARPATHKLLSGPKAMPKQDHKALPTSMRATSKHAARQQAPQPSRSRAAATIRCRSCAHSTLIPRSVHDALPQQAARRARCDRWQ